MYLIDTNIHAAYLLQNFETDTLTKKYISLYENISLANRVIPGFIIGELELFMIKVIPSRYQLNKKDTQKIKDLTLTYLTSLTHHSTLINTEVKTIQRGSEIFLQNSTTHYISFTDALLLATAEQFSYTLLTQDKKLLLLAEKLKIPYYKIGK